MRAATSSNDRQRGFESAVATARELEREAADGMLAESDAENSIRRSSVIAFGLACAAYEIDRVERIADREKGEPTCVARLEAVEKLIGISTRFAVAERDRVCVGAALAPIEIVRAGSMVDLARVIVEADRAIRDAQLYRDGFVATEPRPIALSLAAEQLDIVKEERPTMEGNLTTFAGAANALRWWLTPAGLPEAIGELSRIEEARRIALRKAGMRG